MNVDWQMYEALMCLVNTGIIQLKTAVNTGIIQYDVNTYFENQNEEIPTFVINETVLKKQKRKLKFT